MRLLFNTEKYDNISINIDRVNIINGCNGSGKSLFCKHLKDGFEGKMGKSFYFDGNELSKSDYTVYYVSETDNIDNEKSLSSKSMLKSMVSSRIKDLSAEEVEGLERNITILNEEVNEVINNSMFSDKEYKVEVESSLLDYYFEFARVKGIDMNLENLNYSNKKLIYLKLIQDAIGSIKRPTILIIDEFDIGLSRGKAKLIMDELKSLSQLNDVIVFVSSSNYYDEQISSIYLFQDEISNDLISMIDIKDFTATSENCNLSDLEELSSDDEINEFFYENIAREELLLHFLNSSKNYADNRELWSCFSSKTKL